MKQRVWWLLLLACLMLAGGCGDDGERDGPLGEAIQADSQDTDPPSLACGQQPNDCAITPASVNVTSASAQVTVRIHVVDAPAGLQSGAVVLRSPSGAQSQVAQLHEFVRVQGTALDGIYENVVTIPRYAEAGTWTAYLASLVDGVNNFVTLYEPELTAAGFPVPLTVASDPDLAAPQIDCAQPGSCGITPSNANATLGPAQVTVRIRLKDAVSGFSSGAMQLRSPSGAHSYGALLHEFVRVQGDANDGIYESVVTIPRYAEAGTWTAYGASLLDVVGNLVIYSASQLAATGFPATFTLQSISDLTPPSVSCTAPVISPASVDTSAGPVPVTVRLRITDALSGFMSGAVSLRSPSGVQTEFVSLHEGLRVQGDANDGIYEGVVTLPRYSEQGSWLLYNLIVMDGVSNTGIFNGASLGPTGCAATLTICHGSDPCNDGDACTTGDHCSNGACVAGAPTSCDDGDACTTDACQSPTGCVHTPVSCDDGNPCTTDACSPASGCSHANNSAPCDDGNACTTGDQCVNGTCASGSPVVCGGDGNVCTDEVCNPAVGCVHVANEASCNDGNVCSVGASCFAGQCFGGAFCGDDNCCDAANENACNCPSDCGGDACGNGCCGPGETSCNCPSDCGASCGDGCCNGSEDACTCPSDCGAASCGNGRCEVCAGENSCNCAADCGASCGDGCCTATETACGCPGECAPRCGDGCCNGGETSCDCPGDCGAPSCGNGKCEVCAGEDSCNCPADCGAVTCGDGVCAKCGESACSCPQDCAQGQACPGGCAGSCGDGCCGANESACNCPSDCGSRCGDGCCTGSESACNCPSDCGASSCGNGRCDACAGETPCSCPGDCGASCGDGCCNGDETACTCPDDCGKPEAGNGRCDVCAGENTCKNPGDCGAACGDGCCNGSETACDCPADCGSTKCGNGECEPCAGETACSCPGDCGGPSACGDGQCCGSEDRCSCPVDCGPSQCGDGVCCAGQEDACSCPQDCESETTSVVFVRGKNGNVFDTYLDQGSPSTVRGGSASMLLGQAAGKQYRPLVSVDFANMIPVNATILSALLKLPPSFSPPLNVEPISVYRLIQPWKEGIATWDNYNDPAYWDAAPSASGAITGGITTIDITSIVASWINGSHVNQGIMLLKSAGPVRTLSASETGGAITKRPSLIVKWALCNG